MYKKFYSILVFSSILISFIFSSLNSNIDSENYIYPTDIIHISSYYGYRMLFNKQNFHNGIDFPAPENSKIYATKSGTITFCGFTSGYGICVTILHFDGTKSMYGHMSEKIIVKVGEKIIQGQTIGYVGPKVLSSGLQNGWTTGPHLHFSLFDVKGNTIDPSKFKYTKKVNNI